MLTKHSVGQAGPHQLSRSVSRPTLNILNTNSNSVFMATFLSDDDLKQ